VKWFKGSGEFGAWVRIRERVDQRTFAHDAFAGTKLPNRPEAVPIDAWLDGSFERGATVHEESRAMPSYNGVLTLLWLKDNREPIDDDALESLDPTEFGLGRKTWPGKSKRRR
jgi:hypothetical protein